MLILLLERGCKVSFSHDTCISKRLCKKVKILLSH